MYDCQIVLTVAYRQIHFIQYGVHFQLTLNRVDVKLGLLQERRRAMTLVRFGEPGIQIDLTGTPFLNIVRGNMHMRAYERLLNYVRIHTTSDEDVDTQPTSARQFDLANNLVNEMRALGLEQVRVSESAYVYGILPATPGYESKTALGFIAHMDTSPNASGEHVNPQIHANYVGGDVVLSADPANPVILTVERFPHLAALKGRTLITTDGTTLLGADDKAGIAEILTACETIIREQIPHGRICVGFTPDEEVGKGADRFDISGFGADYAYTMDGGEEGELEYENFNAAEAILTIQGVAVHPGSAKNIMVNALVVACELNALLPAAETPAHTEDREGFYYLRKLEGTPDRVSMAYSLRDHDQALLFARKRTLQHAVKTINERYGEGTVSLTLSDRYRNMLDVIRQEMHLVDRAKDAMARIGLQPIIVPMRGGTDGATLSFKGLPCPNLGTGGHAYHGVYEHITVEAMDTCTALIVELVQLYAESAG